MQMIASVRLPVCFVVFSASALERSPGHHVAGGWAGWKWWQEGGEVLSRVCPPLRVHVQNAPRVCFQIRPRVSNVRRSTHQITPQHTPRTRDRTRHRTHLSIHHSTHHSTHEHAPHKHPTHINMHTPTHPTQTPLIHTHHHNGHQDTRINKIARSKLPKLTPNPECFFSGDSAQKKVFPSGNHLGHSFRPMSFWNLFAVRILCHDQPGAALVSVVIACMGLGIVLALRTIGEV